MSYRLALLLLLHDRSRFGVRAFLTARTSSSSSSSSWSSSSWSSSYSPSQRLLSSKEDGGGFFDDYDDFVTNLDFDRGGWDNSGGPVASSSSSSDRGGGGGRGRDYGGDAPRGRGGRGGGGRGGFRTSGETRTTTRPHFFSLLLINEEGLPSAGMEPKEEGMNASFFFGNACRVLVPPFFGIVGPPGDPPLVLGRFRSEGCPADGLSSGFAFCRREQVFVASRARGRGLHFLCVEANIDDPFFCWQFALRRRRRRRRRIRTRRY